MTLTEIVLGNELILLLEEKADLAKRDDDYMISYVEGILDQVDKNGDGYIDLEEYTTYNNKLGSSSATFDALFRKNKKVINYFLKVLITLFSISFRRGLVYLR
jgi:hypothetical protein